MPGTQEDRLLGEGEKVMDSILEMLVDMSVRCGLSCRRMGASGVQLRKVVWAESTDSGVISVWIVRGDQPPRESRTKEVKEKS